MTNLRRWVTASSTDPRTWGGLGLLGPGLWLFRYAPTSPSIHAVYISAAVAFSVAGSTQVISALTEHLKDARREADDLLRREAEESAARRADLDETRRVCLIALAADSAEAYATAVNALTHHSHIMSSTDARQVLTHFVDQTLDGRRGVLQRFGKQRVQDTMTAHVNKICELLGDDLTFPPEPADEAKSPRATPPEAPDVTEPHG